MPSLNQRYELVVISGSDGDVDSKAFVKHLNGFGD
jgi:hypothetical protein